MTNSSALRTLLIGLTSLIHLSATSATQANALASSTLQASETHTIAIVEYPFTNSPSDYGRGLNVDWVSAALDSQAIKHRFKYLPIKRAFQWFEENRYIAMIGTDRFFSEHFRAQTSLVEIEPAYIRLFYHKRHHPFAEVKTLSDLSEYHVVSTYARQEVLAPNVKQLTQTREPKNILDMLRFNRADLGLMLDQTAAHLIKQHYSEDIYQFGVIDTPLRSTHSGLVFNHQFQQADALSKAFQQGLATIKADGTLEQIKRRYFGKTYFLLTPPKNDGHTLLGNH